MSDLRRDRVLREGASARGAQTVRPSWTRRRTKRWRVSLTGRWLPQFDLVSLGVDDPAKRAVLGVVDLVDHVTPLRRERRDQCAKIFDTVVDHERGCARRKLPGFLGSDQPGGRS